MNYVNVIEALNERFLNSRDCKKLCWSFNYKQNHTKLITFNDIVLWNLELDSDNYTEETLLEFCDKQYREYIAKLYRTLEL